MRYSKIVTRLDGIRKTYYIHNEAYKHEELYRYDGFCEQAAHRLAKVVIHGNKIVKCRYDVEEMVEIFLAAREV